MSTGPSSATVVARASATSAPSRTSTVNPRPPTSVPAEAAVGGVALPHRHPGPEGGQAGGDASSDAGPATGHHGHAPVESGHARIQGHG